MRGSVVRRGKAVYVVLYQGTDPETKRERRKWISGFEDEKQAQAFLVTVAASPAYGSGVGPRGSSRLRLGDYLDYWLRTEVKMRCRSTEQRRRESIVRVHLKPRLGHVPLARLAPATLEEYFASLECRSAPNIYKMLRAALNHAVRLDYILANPLDRVTTPKVPKYRATIWSVDDTLRFLETARRISAHYTLYLAEISTGLRLGEILGLQWRGTD